MRNETILAVKEPGNNCRRRYRQRTSVLGFGSCKIVVKRKAAPRLQSAECLTLAQSFVKCGGQLSTSMVVKQQSLDDSCLTVAYFRLTARRMQGRMS